MKLGPHLSQGQCLKVQGLVRLTARGKPIKLE
jgi:hypothetical protein